MPSRYLTYLYSVLILSLPFTSAFAISGTINLPVIFSMITALGFLNYIFWNIANKIKFITPNILPIYLLLLFISLSFFINALSFSFSLNHYLAYTASIFLFLLIPYWVLQLIIKPSWDFSKILHLLTITVFISSIFSVIEFVSVNVFNWNLSEMLPRSLVQEYYPVFSGFLVRSRGFAEESGHFGFMMELFMPLVIYYLHFSHQSHYPKNLKWIITCCMISSIFTSFSVSTFIILPLAFLLSCLLFGKAAWARMWKYKRKVALAVGIFFIFWISINIFYPINEIIWISITERFDSTSFQDRAFRTNFFWNLIPQIPFEQILFGVGQSWFRILGYDEYFSFLSFYQTLFIENGLFALMCWIIFLILLLIRIMQLKNSIRFFLMISFLAGVIHYNIIANYWYPWFWIVCSWILILPTIKDEASAA